MITRSPLRIALCALALVLAAVRAQATVSIQVEAGTLANSTGTALSSGDLILLVADTSDNGFGSLQGGSNLSLGSLLNGDDMIIGRATSSAGGELFGAFDGITLNSTLNAGDPLEIVWFSGLTSGNSTLPSGESYGSFAGGLTPLEASPWEVPADGTTLYQLNFDTASNGAGPYANSAGYEDMTAVPEPGTYGLLAAMTAGLGAVAWSRRPRPVPVAV